MVWLIWKLNTLRIVSIPDSGVTWLVAIPLNSTERGSWIQKAQWERSLVHTNRWAIPEHCLGESWLAQLKTMHEACYWSDGMGNYQTVLSCFLASLSFLVWIQAQVPQDGLLLLGFTPLNPVEQPRDQQHRERESSRLPPSLCLTKTEE